MMKRHALLKIMLVLVFTVTQVMSAFSPVLAGSKTDADRVSISVSASTDPVKRGEPFDVNVTINNNSNESISNVKINIRSSSDNLLSPVNSDWSISVGDIQGEDSHTETIRLIYIGNEVILPISFSCTYTYDGSQSSMLVKSINMVFSSGSTETPPSTDISKVEPVVRVKPNISMPVFRAGESVTISLPVVNSSIYEARNISATIDTSNMDSLPFTFDSISLVSSIDKLQSNKEGTISYKVNIKPDAKEGIYPIKINYKLYSVYNKEYTSSEIIYIKILNDKTPPKLVLENIRTYSNDPTPGNNMAVELILKNHGMLEANDVKVTLTGLSSETVTTYKSVVSRYLQKIEGQGEGTAEFMLIISENFKGTNISLGVKVEYKDGTGKEYTEEYPFFIPIKQKAEPEKKKETKPELAMFNLNFPTEVLRPGDEFDLSFTLVNNGNDDAKNVKVSVTCENGILPKSMSTVLIDSLGSGESKDLKFTLFADKGTTTKNHLITINIEYENVLDDIDDNKDKRETTEKYAMTRYAGVYIEKEEEKKEEQEKTVPKIIISRYSFEPEDVRAGQNFILKLTFLNTSKIVPIRNVKITFNADEGVFIPTNSSNAFYIEEMGIQTAVEREVELYPKSDAVPKSHILNLNFEYEDEKGNQYTASEKISIPVKQQQKLVLGQLSMPQSAMMGETIPLYLDFYNMGKSTLYNLMVQLEGEGLQTDMPNYFAGNFEAGRSDYYECMITPLNPGQVSGAVVFTYEDEAGNKQEMRQEISINVMSFDMPMRDIDIMPADIGMPETKTGDDWKSKLLTPLNIGIACGVVLVIVIVLIILLRRRRIRKAGMFVDE